jgi:hypothetical protein
VVKEVKEAWVVGMGEREAKEGMVVREVEGLRSLACRLTPQMMLHW